MLMPKKSCIEFCTQRGSHKKFHTMKRKKTLHIKSSHIMSLHIENIHINWSCFHDSRHWTLNFRQHETKKMKWNINRLPMAMTWNGHLQPPTNNTKELQNSKNQCYWNKILTRTIFLKISSLNPPLCHCIEFKVDFCIGDT